MKKITLVIFLLVNVTSSIWAQIPEKGKYHMYSVYEILKEVKKGEKWEVDTVYDLFVNQIYVLNDQYILYNNKNQFKEQLDIIENLTPIINQQYAATFSKVKADGIDVDCYFGVRSNITSGEKEFLFAADGGWRLIYKVMFLYEDDDYKIR